MTAPAQVSNVPDLIIPTGRVTLQTGTEVRAVVQIDHETELDVLLPAGTQYFLEIGRVFKARWRPSAGPTEPDGIWSFWCEVGAERAWLETDGTSWQINHSIVPPDAQAQPGTPLDS